MASRITDLPPEMLLMVFENLNLHELVNNCSRTCLQWKALICQYILRPQIVRLANVNGQFKRAIIEDGWTEETQEFDFILSLYPKYEIWSSKYHCHRNSSNVVAYFHSFHYSH